MANKHASNVERLYPEVGAGGFSRVDGTIAFYTRINALLRPDFTVLDLGAGRGAQLMKNPDSYKTKLATLQGKVRKVVGVDVDDAVLDNQFLDEAKIISIGEPYPFPDNSFDLIYADWVLEHVDNPNEFTAEIARVLKPGGWFCARTPNRFGMVGILTNFVPNRLHTKLLSKLQPNREAVDVFPTTYKMNTLGRLRKYFRSERWENYSYITNPEPPYVQGSLTAMRAVKLGWRVVPNVNHTVLNVFAKLKPSLH